MRLTGHQPNYLPYPGFFHKLLHADAFVIVDHVQFVKRGSFGWIHRNRIRTEDGWAWLTVPVITKGRFEQRILDVRPNNALNWTRKHWRSIEWHYKKAPFFKDHAPFFEDTYSRTWDNLSELNIFVIQYIMRQMEIDLPIYRSSELDIQGKAGQLIIDMCRKLGADTYLSGVHGRDYLDLDLFKEAKIKLAFQTFDPAPYPQVYKGDFVPDLAIIDLLMNRGPESRTYLEAS